MEHNRILFKLLNYYCKVTSALYCFFYVLNYRYNRSSYSTACVLCLEEKCFQYGISILQALSSTSLSFEVKKSTRTKFSWLIHIEI